MPNFPTRQADVMVLSSGADPQTGLSASEVLLSLVGVTENQIVVDTALTEMPGCRAKTLVVVVATALTWVSAGQATLQLFAARTKYGVLGGDTGTTTGGPIGWTAPTTPYTGGSGATTTIPTGNVPNSSALIGTAINLGGAGATTLVAGTYWFSASANAILGDWYPVLGVEFKFPSALTGGAFTAFFEVAPV